MELHASTGPRAGFNFNDGFYGRNWLENNLIFNMVRETGEFTAFIVYE